MKIFLDSSVIIYGLEKPGSNSAKVLDALIAGELDAVVNEKVVQEVGRYMRRRQGKQSAYLVESLVRNHTTVVQRNVYQDIIPDHFIDSSIHKHYPEKDYHRMYVGRVIEALKR